MGCYKTPFDVTHFKKWTERELEGGSVLAAVALGRTRKQTGSKKEKNWALVERGK